MKGGGWRDREKERLKVEWKVGRREEGSREGTNRMGGESGHLE